MPKEKSFPKPQSMDDFKRDRAKEERNAKARSKPAPKFNMNVKPSKEDVRAVNEYRKEQKQTAFSEKDVAEFNGLNYLSSEEYKNLQSDDRPAKKNKK